MAAIDLNAQTLNDFTARVSKINSDTAGQWGSKTAGEMIAHLTQAVAIGMGEESAPSETNFIKANIMRPIIFSGLMPWPKAKIKSPEIFHPAPAADFDQAKAGLIDLYGRFVKRCADDPSRAFYHPVFGDLTMTQQQRVFGMHSDHHLRQFGV